MLANDAREDFLKEQVDKNGEIDKASLDTNDAGSLWLNLWENQKAFYWYKGENVS